MKYIDTSAFVKYYGKEESEKGVEKITELINKAKAGEEELTSSVFMVGEAISVFDRWVSLKIINEKELNMIISKFSKDIEELVESNGLTLQGIDTALILFSTEIILKHHIPINDSIHLHTALNISPKIEEFICSDKNLNDAAKKENLIVFDPED